MSEEIKYKRSKKDIQIYQSEYYKKNSEKVKCEICNKMITIRNLTKHNTSYYHLNRKYGRIVKKRKTRWDKGIKLKDKYKPEFQPTDKLVFVI